MRALFAAALCAAAFVCAACTQTATNLPQSTPVDPVASNTLQFAVGVATIADPGSAPATGLNVVETLRQADGLSGTLFNVPAILGPAGFSITTSTALKSSQGIVALARGDYSTNRITQQTFDTQFATGYNTGNPLVAVPSSGAFGYGLCACNANSGPINGTPQLYHAYRLPFYAGITYGPTSNLSITNLQYYGGPPAFPAATPDLVQAGFNGYSAGFSDFAVSPIAGSYTLNVAIPPEFYGPTSTPTPEPSPSSSPVPTLTASATLKSVQGLPLFPTPQFTSDIGGGGSIIVNVPAGVTESLVFIQEGTSGGAFCNGLYASPLYYTFLVRGSGIKNVTVPDSIGPGGAPTLCSGSPYFIYAAGFDYPAYEAAYPQSTAQKPIITGANGQVDVTTSDAAAGVY